MSDEKKEFVQAVSKETRTCAGCGATTPFTEFHPPAACIEVLRAQVDRHRHQIAALSRVANGEKPADVYPPPSFIALDDVHRLRMERDDAWKALSGLRVSESSYQASQERLVEALEWASKNADDLCISPRGGHLRTVCDMALAEAEALLSGDATKAEKETP